MKKLTTREQALVGLAAALLFSVVLTLVGYLAGGQTREQIAALAEDGAVVDGRVTDKRQEMAAKNMTWWLEVEFKTDKGVDRQETQLVANSIYDRYGLDSPIKVTYVRSRPEWFFLPGRVPTPRDIAMSDGMFEYGGVASFLFFAGLVGLIVTGGNGGPPQRNFKKTRMTADAPSPTVAGRAPGQFGRRRPT